MVFGNLRKKSPPMRPRSGQQFPNCADLRSAQLAADAERLFQLLQARGELAPKSSVKYISPLRYALIFRKERSHFLEGDTMPIVNMDIYECINFLGRKRRGDHAPFEQGTVGLGNEILTLCAGQFPIEPAGNPRRSEAVGPLRKAMARRMLCHPAL